MWLLVPIAAAGSSLLWGEAGERWDPAGRLPDYSFAGYHSGQDEPASVPQVVDVRDFGARGDGVADDTAAIQAAIDAAADGAVWLPAGSYRLTGVLHVRNSGVVLRGDGPDATVLAFEVSLEDLYGPSESWSWSGGLVEVGPEAYGPAWLTDVAEPAVRADRELAVDDTAGLEPGMLVELRMTDPDGSLGLHLHNDQHEAGDCSWQDPLTLTWPVRLAAVDDGVVRLDQPLRTDVRLEWTPQLFTAPYSSEQGVEDLAVVFPETEYAGHLLEPGYNGIVFTRGTVDGWVRRVRIENADNGILSEQTAKNLSFSDVELTGRNGHHGFNLAFSHDLLLSGFTVQADFVHAVSVDHRTSGCVVERGSAAWPMELDHHRDSPFENLFTELHGDIVFLHGGSACAGAASGARETFWNLDGPLAPPPWGYIQANVVGDLTIDGDQLSEDNEWYEDVDALQPHNLYRAQRAMRLGLDYRDTGLGLEVGEDPSASEDGCGCGAARGAGPPAVLLALLGLARRRP